jgi:hypothetical protein
MIRPRLHFASALAGAIFSLFVIIANIVPHAHSQLYGWGFPLVMMVHEGSYQDALRRKSDLDLLKGSWRILDGSLRIFPNAVFVNFFTLIAGTTLIIVAIEYTIRKHTGQLPPPIKKENR